MLLSLQEQHSAEQFPPGQCHQAQYSRDCIKLQITLIKKLFFPQLSLRAVPQSVSVKKYIFCVIYYY